MIDISGEMIVGAFLVQPMRAGSRLYELTHHTGGTIGSPVPLPTHLVSPSPGEDHFVFVRHDGLEGLPFYRPHADNCLESIAFLIDITRKIYLPPLFVLFALFTPALQGSLFRIDLLTRNS